MARIRADKVAETSTTTGTGDITLAGALTGYRTFDSVLSTSDTFSYSITAVDGSGAPTGEWETGVGTYSGSSVFVRTTVAASSNAGAAVNFSAGTKRVVLTLLAEEIGVSTQHIEVAMSDLYSELAAGDNKASWAVPYDFTLAEVFTAVTTAQSTSGAVTIDIRVKGGSTIFTTPPSIDANEDTSLTGTAAVLATTALTKGQILLFDLDADGTGAKGLVAVLVGTPT